MSETNGGCAVCGARGHQATRMSKVVIEGRTLELCRSHAATVVAAMPETFDDLRKLFVGVAFAAPRGKRKALADATATAADGATVFNGAERRSPIGRRAADDRRVFPPRFEGRRRSSGRRASDPIE